MYYKLIPKGVDLFSYIELSNEAKQIAISELVNSESLALSNNIRKYKLIPLHKRISNKPKTNPINTYVYKKNFLIKLKTNPKYLERFVNENLLQFTINGNYVTYCS